MKRLELIEHLEILATSLRSADLATYNYRNDQIFLYLCFDSRTGYDQLPIETKKLTDPLFKTFDYYNSANFSALTKQIFDLPKSNTTTNIPIYIYSSPQIVNFINLQITIQKTLEALKSTFNTHTELALENNQIDTKGIKNSSLFVLTIQREKNISLDDFNDIIGLITQINKDLSAFQEEKTEAQISFIDLGSDIDIFLDLGKIIAPLLVPLCKIVWDAFTTQNKDTEKIEKEMNVLLKTHELVEKGLLSRENADIIIKRCQENIEKLIKKGVLPKQILESKNNTSNAELLQKATEIKQLPPSE